MCRAACAGPQPGRQAWHHSTQRSAGHTVSAPTADSLAVCMESFSLSLTTCSCVSSTRALGAGGGAAAAGAAWGAATAAMRPARPP